MRTMAAWSRRRPTGGPGALDRGQRRQHRV